MMTDGELWDLARAIVTKISMAELVSKKDLIEEILPILRKSINNIDNE